MKSIGILGDSIAHGYGDQTGAGWFARLETLILEKHNHDAYLFTNMAQAGDNVADTMHRAISEVLSRHFDLILANTGTNDVRRRKNSDLQLDFSEGARMMYWNKMLDILALTKAKVVVLDLLPVVEHYDTEDESVVRYNADIERYNEIIAEICKERKIAFFARYDQWKKKNLEILYQDAAHPNAKGHELLAQEVYSYLTENKIL